MRLPHDHPALPVILLSNLDPSWPANVIDEALLAAQDLSMALQQVGHLVEVVNVETDQIEWLLRNYDPAHYIVLNWCEELPGLPHSGDLVARRLEQLGFAYTGADSSALTLCQDKRRVKQRLAGRHIPTPRWQIYATPAVDGWSDFPAIVKPAFEHCSYGITREAVVLSSAELQARVQYVIETFQQPALVEEFIVGREFHASIVGNGVLQVLPVAEMDFSAFDDIHDQLCSYDSKFTPESPGYRLTQLRLPAPLTAGEQRQITNIALAAYRAINCRDYARIDIRQHDGVFYVLDINPNADISPDTSLALSAELVGLSYGQLISLLVSLAAKRHPIWGALGRGNYWAPAAVLGQVSRD
jgi:D-alanine-D-alanine ligase